MMELERLRVRYLLALGGEVRAEDFDRFVAICLEVVERSRYVHWHSLPRFLRADALELERRRLYPR